MCTMKDSLSDEDCSKYVLEGLGVFNRFPILVAPEITIWLSRVGSTACHIGLLLKPHTDWNSGARLVESDCLTGWGSVRFS